MKLDEKLDALRAIVQRDVGGRGLSGEMFSTCAGDLAAACVELAAGPALGTGIVTGFFIPGPDRPETDGPPGAVFLARALDQCGITATLIADPFCHAALKAGLDECRLVLPIVAVPATPERLSHVIAIERVGPAHDGRCYTMRGIDITEKMQNVEPLFRGVRSIGIGDGGNEVGMGKLPREVIARNVPRGDTIACRVATDHLIVAGISNWGAWALGVGTVLACGLRPAIDIDLERRVLARMIAEGNLVDGVAGGPSLSVDGLAFDQYIQPLMEMEKVARS